MKLFNTLTHKVEEFIPNEAGHVKMYTCGPTVYNYAHIGNLRTYIFEDILEKSLKYLGYEVTRCMNITDVGHLTSDSDTGEDKMLKGAQREQKTVLEIAEFYTEAFKHDFLLLNNKWPQIVSPATDNIPMYLKMIEKLLTNDYAYISGGNVYFDTSKLTDYYQLTHHKIDEMVVGAREGVDEDNSKKNQSDFVLWFTKSKFANQELKWESPWGVGYPGWHIECSGISISYLGEYLDIHCGGVDNIFPHHTNEIAQSEAFLGHKWCNYWIHGEHLNTMSGKMSKSSGEFLTLSLLQQKGYDPLAYRYLCLTSHYRKQLMFSLDILDNASKAYQKLKQKVKSLDKTQALDEKAYANYNDQFKSYLADDLNLANAISLLFELLKSEVNESTKYALAVEWDKVFSLDLDKEEKISELEPFILEKIKERNEAKKNKDFALADKIREELLSQNIILKDTREGTIYEIK